MAPKGNANVGRKRVATDADDQPQAKRSRTVKPTPKRATSEGEKAEEPKAKRTRTATSAAKPSLAEAPKAPPKVASKARSSAKPSTKAAVNTKSSAESSSKVTKSKAQANKSTAAKTSVGTTAKDNKKAAPKVKAEAKPKSAAKSKTATQPKPASKPKAAPEPKLKAAPKPKTVKAAKPLPILSSAPTEKLIVLVCGEGSAGELGLGPKAIDVKRPRVNPLLDMKTVGVVQLAAGGMHCVALTFDNKILTWGVNDQGALGRNTSFDTKTRDADASESEDEDDADLNPKESTPTAVLASAFPEGTKFVQVAAGDSCSFALTDTGLVYGWGTFRDGQGIWGFTLDNHEDIVLQQNTPILIKGVKDITSIGCGADYVLALDKKGEVYGWGNGQQFQLGRKLVERRRNQSLLPGIIPLPRVTKAASIFASSNHAFVIDTEGDTWSWGLNNFAQTGVPAGAGQDGGTTEAPTKVPGLVGRGIRVISGGNHHSIAVSEAGEVFTWGRMDLAQIGIPLDKIAVDDEKIVVKDDRGNPRILLQPTAVQIPPAAYVAAGSDHNVALTKDGKAYTWGLNGTYQLGLGNDDDVAVATLVGNTALLDKQLTWAGAGGQFSIFAGRPAHGDQTKAAGQPLTNGVSSHSSSD